MTDEELAELGILRVRRAKCEAILRRNNIDSEALCQQCEEAEMELFESEEPYHCIYNPYRRKWCKLIAYLRHLNDRIFELENPPNVPLIF